VELVHRIANKSQAAQFFDVSTTTMENWIRKGCPVLVHGARGKKWEIDLLVVARWQFSPDPDEQPGLLQFDPDGPGVSPKDRKDWYDAELKRRTLQTKDGELIPADVFEREQADLVKGVVNFVDILADRMEREAGLDSKQVVKVRKVCDKMRGQLHKKFTRSDI